MYPPFRPLLAAAAGRGEMQGEFDFRLVFNHRSTGASPVVANGGQRVLVVVNHRSTGTSPVVAFRA